MDKPSGIAKIQIEAWLLPALLLAFCIAALIVSTTFKEMPPILKRGIQPADFPQLLLISLILLTAIMAWFDPVQITDKLQPSVYGTMALMAVFVGLAQIDVFLALGIFAAALAALWGERRMAALGLVGVVVPATIFFVFDLVFDIRFPRGLLTNIWYG
jgi:putative tricarboxylic transport membrane protein